MKVWVALQTLKDEGPSEPMFGICSNVESILGELKDDTWAANYEDCFKEWSEFSGCVMYPIAGFSNYGPGSAFLNASRETMWNHDHKYGSARWRLLDHCVEWFKTKDL
jgi:hypothetical protein